MTCKSSFLQFHVEYLVLVLHCHQGSRVHKLLSDVSESPEASVVHRGVAMLVHKVHVSLVAEEQLDNLGILSGDKIKMLMARWSNGVIWTII